MVCVSYTLGTFAKIWREKKNDIIAAIHFKQVRKMTAVVGFPTLRLFRMRIHDTWLGDLVAGGVVEVADFGV